MISSDDRGTGGKLSTISRRMFILSTAKVIVFGGIVARLFSLQISENKKYLTLSDKNRLREWRLPPIRGDFLDYFGNGVAGNTEVYQLHLIPEEVNNFKSLMIRLREILNLSEKEYEKIKTGFEEFSKQKLEEKNKEQHLSKKIDELNQETDILLEEIDKWQM